MRKDFERTSDDSAEQAADKRPVIDLIWAAMGRLRRLKRKLTPVLVIPENGSPKIMSEYSADRYDRELDIESGINAAQSGSSYTDEYRLVPTKSPGVEPEIDQAAADNEISPEEAAWLLELRKSVKVAPRLADHLADDKEDRSNIITYIAGADKSLSTKTSEDYYRGDRAELTEYEMLHQLDEFLAKIEALGGKYAVDAQFMRENLTFIGEKEYKEAASGIAANWKALLEADAKLQICVIAGEIAKSKNSQGKMIYDNQIKSDESLLDNILANFTEEDWEKYGGRILVDRDDIAQTQKEHLRVVLLDDWTISGWQLRKVYISLIGQYPEIKDQIEVQLIAANKQRIKYGLSVDWLYAGEKIPVKAYFSAHYSAVAGEKAHITGSHSAVDFDFESTIMKMIREAERLGVKDIHMPPGTNIVRPYRKDGVTRANLTNIERARQYRRGRLVAKQGGSHAIL